MTRLIVAKADSAWLSGLRSMAELWSHGQVERESAVLGQVMAIPELIPIRREKGYHTDQIGTYLHGQYVGFALFLKTHQRRLISVLHLFDRTGAYVRTDAWDSLAGHDAHAALRDAIAALPDSTPGHVRVAAFSEPVFGTQFGLICSGGQHVDYMPYGLRFTSPWDGTYDT